MDITKRKFIIQGSQVVMAAALVPSFVNAAEKKKARFELALSQYSLRALLRDGSLKAVDFPQFTVDNFGIKAIDVWEGGLPKDKLDDKAYLTGLKTRADKAGTDLYLLMAGCLFTSGKRAEKSAKDIETSIGRAQILGTKYLRIFLDTKSLDAAVPPLKKLADKAAAKNVILIIEPRPGSKAQYGKFLAELSQKLNHPSLTLMPDFGKQKNNIYDGTEAMLPHSQSISAKMHSFDDKGLQPDFDYDRLAKIIVDSKYNGYIAIEWEGKKLKPIPGVKASQKILRESFAKHGVVIS